MDELSYLPRLLVSIGIGALIGWNRQRQGKPAGLRTHVMVALGATLIMLLGSLMREHSGDPADAGRIVQGVLTGIGFIGAGTIIRHGNTVVGLTTASTVWMVAILGLVTGAGFLITAVAGTLLSFLSIEILGWIESRMRLPESTAHRPPRSTGARRLRRRPRLGPPPL